jgi:hypothetical protein
MFPAKNELGFYIPEVCILHSHRREDFKSYTVPSRSCFGTCFLNTRASSEMQQRKAKNAVLFNVAARQPHEMWFYLVKVEWFKRIPSFGSTNKTSCV